MPIARRRFLTASAAAIAVACGGGVAPPAMGATALGDRLDEISRDIVSGGPPPDGIPLIEKPRFLPSCKRRQLASVTHRRCSMRDRSQWRRARRRREELAR